MDVSEAVAPPLIQKVQGSGSRPSWPGSRMGGGRLGV
jgi:hypothetical protein